MEGEEWGGKRKGRKPGGVDGGQTGHVVQAFGGLDNGLFRWVGGWVVRR